MLPVTTLRTGRNGAATARAPASGIARLLASAPVLQFFCNQILHRRIVQRQFSVHALELCILSFQLLDPLQVRCLHPAVLRFPLVVRWRADARLATDVLHRYTGVGLLEDRDD